VRYATAEFLALPGDALDVLVRDGVTVGLGGGRLRFIGGLLLAYVDGVVDLRGFELRAGNGATMSIDVVDAAGTVWFTADHAHHEFSSGMPPEFSMRQMDLRLSPHFAGTLGSPHLAGHVGQDLVAAVHLHPEHRVGQRLDHLALHLDCIFLLAHGLSP